MRRAAVLVLAVWTCLPRPVLGQGAGGSTANFLKIGAGARAVGMGEAFGAVADDPTAMYWNPAGLALVRGTGISATRGLWMDGVSHDYVALAYGQAGFGGFGVSFNTLSSGLFPQALETPQGEYGGEGPLVSASDVAGSLAYAQRLGVWGPGGFLRRSLAGLKFNYVGQRAVSLRAAGISFDLGYLYELKKRKMYLALVLLNGGSRFYRAPQPLLMRLGFSYKKRKLFSSVDEGTFGVQADGYMDTGFQIHTGAEYRRHFGSRIASLRAGYRVGGDLGPLSGLTTGAGLETPMAGLDLGLDYAFVPYGLLGLTHRLTLNLSAGARLQPPEALLSAPSTFWLGADKPNLESQVHRWEPLAEWSIKVKDMEGKEVKEFKGRNQDPPPKLPWDGKDKSGTLVPPGPYRLDLKVKDDEEQEAEARPLTILAQVPPTPTVTPTMTPVPKAPYNFKFHLSGDLLFESGSAELKPRGFQALDAAVSIIQARYEGSSIVVAGFTDNVRVREVSPYGDNVALSLARAKAVKDYLATKNISDSRMSILGYGATLAIADNETEEGRAQNRRVEILVLGEKVQTAPDLIEEARLLVGQGSWRDALEAIGKSLTLDPSSPEAYSLAATCYMRLGQGALAYSAQAKARELEALKNKK